MERLILSGSLTADQEICFNRYRLSYQAMTLADIMTGDGSKVTKHALEVSRLSWASSKWNWPNECPSNRDIHCWCKGLHLITSENWGLPFSMCLERWIHPSHLNWQWFYQHQDHSLYHLVNNVCHVFRPFSPCSSVVYKWVEILSSLPVQFQECEWATVRYDWGRF
jgi:hypothetical protein